jgi:hypothetical protein
MGEVKIFPNIPKFYETSMMDRYNALYLGYYSQSRFQKGSYFDLVLSIGGQFY